MDTGPQVTRKVRPLASNLWYNLHMPYDDPSLSELRGYFKAKEPGKRACAEAWATAIGLQDVDHLRVSSFWG